MYQANIPEDIADSIPLIPVGYNKATLYFPNPWLIPCDADWRLSFIFSLNKKLGNDAMGGLVDELRGNAPVPPPGSDNSCADLILNLITGSTQRINVSTESAVVSVLVLALLLACRLAQQLQQPEE